MRVGSLGRIPYFQYPCIVDKICSGMAVSNIVKIVGVEDAICITRAISSFSVFEEALLL